MKAAIVIAHRPGIPERDRLLDYVVRQYRLAIISDSPGKVFSRAAAFNAGIQAAVADVVICLNSDTVIWQGQLDRAAEIAYKKRVTVYPFNRYAELSEACTEQWLAGETSWRDVAYEMGVDSVGPAFVIRRDAYLSLGGMDERFTGWGFEDVAWEITSRTLLGRSKRVPGTAWHLWHPFHPDSRRGGGEDGPTFQRNQRLCDRYRRASGKADRLARVRRVAS